jgi:hypothetical protein
MFMHSAPALFSHRPYWAARFGVAPFLPMSRAEIAVARPAAALAGVGYP